MCKQGRLSKRVKEWKVLFNYLFQCLQEEFSMFVTTSNQMIINRDPIQLMSTQESTDEAEESIARMLFRRGQALSTDEDVD
jgi:hypothetical protein